MANATELEKVRLACRIVTTAYDSELGDLIDAAKKDLQIAGVVLPTEIDAITMRAVVTYCKANFGDPESYGDFKRSYDEQKAQLSNATGYTNWGDSGV